MADTPPQEHVDSRALAHYGTEFDESDRLVGRSGQGVLEFERTQSIIRDRVAAESRIIDIGGHVDVPLSEHLGHGADCSQPKAHPSPGESESLR